jgi:hypothetical protein
MAAVEAPDIDYQFFLPPEVKKVLYNKAKNLDLIKLVNFLFLRHQLFFSNDYRYLIKKIEMRNGSFLASKDFLNFVSLTINISDIMYI